MVYSTIRSILIQDEEHPLSLITIHLFGWEIGWFMGEMMLTPHPLPAPVATSPASTETIPGLAGRWNDPHTSGTVTTIIWANGQYTVQSVINPSRGGNEVTKSSWSNNGLIWTYCVPDGYCFTTMTASVNGDNLDTFWTDDHGNSGQDTLTRLP